MDDRCTCMVLNYNDYSTTFRFVESIKSYRCFKAIVVIDNSSTDDSYIKLQKLSMNNVYVIRTEKNGGYGYGNNFGVKYIHENIQSKYILLCNPDVYIDEMTVEQMIDSFSVDDKISIVSAVQKDNSGNIIDDIAWDIPSAFRYALEGSGIGRRIYKNANNRPYLNSITCYVECVPGACLMLDTEKFLSVGGYDERMFLYCEETVLGIKMKQSGFRTLLRTDLFYRHEHSTSISKSISSIKKQKEMIYKSRRFVMKEYLSANVLVLGIARILQNRSISKLDKEG